MNKRRTLIPITAVAAVLAVLIPLGFAIAPGALAEVTSSSAQPTHPTASITRVERVRPPRKVVIHRHFRPWARPTPGQVQEIIQSESRRWGIPAGMLMTRVACESHYHWWASNGQFQGVLQFGANAFYRGLSTIRTRAIRLVRWHSRLVHAARITHYSDGHKVRRRTTPLRQRVQVILKGRLPKHPSMVNPWAQIRIGAQAIRGISAVHSSEWSCAA
jgi:hypothetical protein